MEKYHCKICKKKHEIFFGIELPLPEKLQILLDEKSTEIIEYQGNYLYKENTFIKGVLKIPTEYDIPFRFYCWITASAREFVRITNNWKSGEEFRINGKLVNDLFPWFEMTNGLKIEAYWQSKKGMEPFLEVEIAEKGISQEYQKGQLSADDFTELMTMIYHRKK